MATTSRKAENGILASVHTTASGLHKAELVDKATMREFDALCLTPVEPLTPDEIRRSENASRSRNPSLRTISMSARTP